MKPSDIRTLYRDTNGRITGASVAIDMTWEDGSVTPVTMAFTRTVFAELLARAVLSGDMTMREVEEVAGMGVEL